MPKLPSKDTLSPSETKVGHSFEVRLKENKIFVCFFVCFSMWRYMRLPQIQRFYEEVTLLTP
jgi:hypothetical protein